MASEMPLTHGRVGYAEAGQFWVGGCHREEALRQNRWLDILIALLIVIAALYLVQLLWHIGLQFAHVLLLFFVAWVVAFLLTPLVEVLHRLWLPRAIAVTLIYLLLGGLITVLVLLALPGVVAQGNALAAQFLSLIHI